MEGAEGVRSAAEVAPSCDADGSRQADLDSLQGDGEGAEHCRAGEACHVTVRSSQNRPGWEP